MNTGSLSINIASAASWNPNSVNVTYPFSMGSPVLGIFLTINDFNIRVNSGINLSFYGVVNSFSQTSFLLYVYSNTSANLVSLGYRYMAFALNDSKTFGWILVSVIQPVSISLINYYICPFIDVTVPLGGNYTLGFSMFHQYAISFLGYNVVVNYSRLQLDIRLEEGYYTNVSSLTAKVSFCTNYYYWYYNTNFTINGFYFNVLIHNRSQDTTLPYIKN